MKAKDIMLPKSAICILPKDTTVDRIASSMVSKNISCVIIGDEKDNLEGILTKTDLVDLYSSGKRGEETLASDVMETNLQFCKENDSRDKISEDMINHKVHHLLVRNENSEFVGLVSTYDIIRSIASENQEKFPFLTKLFGLQPEKQKKWKDDVTFKFGEKKEVEPEKK